MRSRNVLSRLLIVLLAGGSGMAAATALVGFSRPAMAAEIGNSSGQLASQIRNGLRGKKFQRVTVHVSGSTATLSGEVELYAYKAEAIKKAKKVRGIQAVRDNIAVDGPTFADGVLERKLVSRIEVDRVGYGQVFNAISVEVHDGIVTLGGHALGPVAAQSAVSLTRFTPGVKEVIDRISIDPVAPLDDEIRRSVYRAIYGFAALERYAIVPARPIRISVQNSRVTLYGIVDNETDRNLAYIRAMGVPNVFAVTNNLLVGNEMDEQKTR